MKIAVCDEQKTELNMISALLDEYRTMRDIPLHYQTFSSSLTLAEAAPQSGFNLYLLDAVMPDLNGIELAKHLRDFDPLSPIIFLTASPEFALESYLVKASNYLLKPLQKSSLFSVLDDLVEPHTIKQDNCIIVKCSKSLRKIFLPQLLYAEAYGRKVFFHLQNGEQIECSSPFSSVREELLKYPEFIQTHRSYLVNMHFIKTLDTACIELQNQKMLPLAQRRFYQVKAQYHAFQTKDI